MMATSVMQMMKLKKILYYAHVSYAMDIIFHQKSFLTVN